MIAELNASVREQTGDRFEVLGALTQETGGAVVCLARETRERSLVALLLDRIGSRPDGSGQYRVEVLPELEDTVAAIDIRCTGCGRENADGSSTCGGCGADLEPAGPDPLAAVARPDALERIRQAIGGAAELLGELPRPRGGGSIYFARENATGGVFPFRARGGDEEGSGDLAFVPVRLIRRADWAGGSEPMGSSGVGGATAAFSAGSREGASGSPAVAPGAEPGGARECPTCGRTFPPDTRFCPNDGAALLIPANGHDLVGRTIADRYYVVKRLGEGGFGTVFLAEHTRMGRRCALKIINPALRHDADAIGRFTREAAHTSRINHPNIATVYDFGETSDGVIYLVMEYVEGETLADVLRQEGRLTAARAAEIGRQISDALCAAHGLGIVHRDLKPHNVLLTTSHDRTELVKVVDFGIAKAIEGEKHAVTRAGFVIGTLEYMSPEQLAGGAVDGRADIYSLGCVLYEMLSGEKAFAGPDGPISISRRLTEDPPRLSERDVEVPAALEEIVATAVARDPVARFQTAEALRDALAAVVIEESGERAVAALPTGGFASRVPSRVTTSGAASGAGGTGQPTSTVAEPTSAPVRSSGSRRLLAGVLGLAAVAVAVVAVRFLSTGPVSPAPIADEPSQLAATSGEPAEATGPSGANADAPVSPGPMGGPTPGASQAVTAGGPASSDPGAAAAPRAPTASPAGANVGARPELAERGAPEPANESSGPAASGTLALETPTSLPGGGSSQVAGAPVVGSPAASAPSADATASPRGTSNQAADPSIIAARLSEQLAAFARALESRRIEAVAAAYPGMTSTERDTWSAFINGVRTLRVELSDVRIPPVSGATVQVPFTMSFDFTDQRGGQRTAQRYTATFTGNGADWQIAAIRPE